MNQYNQERRFERVPTSVFEDSKQASRHVAGQIASLIREKQKTGANAVLGLATGSSPTSIYDELVRLHREVLRTSCED